MQIGKAPGDDRRRGIAHHHDARHRAGVAISVRGSVGQRIGADDIAVPFGKVDRGVAVAPNRKRRGEALDAYIWVSDVDALYAELKAKGAKILEGPVLRFYRCYELVVEDAFGFCLVFAKDMGPG